MNELEPQVRDRLVEEEMEEYKSFLNEDFDADFSLSTRLKYGAKAPFVKLLYPDQIGMMADCTKKAITQSPSEFKRSAESGYRHICDLIYKLNGPLAETRTSPDLGLPGISNWKRNGIGNRSDRVGVTIDYIVYRVWEEVCEDADPNLEAAAENRHDHLRDMIHTKEEFRYYRGDILEIGINQGIGCLLESGQDDVGIDIASFAQTEEDYTDWKVKRIYG